MPQSSKVRTVSCPRCGKPVAWLAENQFRPFCSERCKMMDLGAWATERYRVPAEIHTSESKEVDDDRA